MVHNRMLSNEEVTITNKNLEVRRKELSELNRELEIRTLFKDKIIPYNREIEDKNINNLIETIKEKISQTEFTINLITFII